MLENTESTTAKLCSFARAYHSLNSDQRIFNDYLAFDLMGREQFEAMGLLIENDYQPTYNNPAHSFSNEKINGKLMRYISPIPLSRAAFAEQELYRFTKERQHCQYIICGAGMDTFSFRNSNENIKIFEIDHPSTQQYKLARIKELGWNTPSNVTFVAVDFAVDDMGEKLITAGFDPSLPSFFAILGVSYYLTLSVFESLLDKICALSSFGSKVVFDFPDDTTFTKLASEKIQTLSKITATLGEPMMHGYSQVAMGAALTRRGFLIDEHLGPAKIQERFFDNRHDGLEAYENIHFILSKKGDTFNDSYYLYI